MEVRKKMNTTNCLKCGKQILYNTELQLSSKLDSHLTSNNKQIRCKSIKNKKQRS